MGHGFGDQPTSAASSRRPTAARPGGARSSATTRPARSSSSIDPKNAERRLHGAVGSRSARRGACRAADPAAACSRSTDGGDTWTEITKNAGLPSRLWGKVGISVSGADSNRVYALIESEPDGGLFVSDDAGATWKKINDDRSIRQRAFYYTRIYADPKVKDTVYDPQRQHLQVDRRRQDARRNVARAARRQPRHVDRARRLRTG